MEVALPHLASDHGMIDTHLIDNNIECMEDGIREVRQMMEQYLEQDVPQMLLQLQQAVERRDAPTMIAVAHTLRGSAAQLGIPSVAHCCRSIEAHGHHGEFTELPSLLLDLGTLFHDARIAVLEYLQFRETAQTSPLPRP